MIKFIIQMKAVLFQKKIICKFHFLHFMSYIYYLLLTFPQSQPYLLIIQEGLPSVKGFWPSFSPPRDTDINSIRQSSSTTSSDSTDCLRQPALRRSTFQRGHLRRSPCIASSNAFHCFCPELSKSRQDDLPLR